MSKFNSELDPLRGLKVYLGVPTHDGRVQNEVVNAILAGGKSMGGVQIEAGSALTFNFNNCYANALNNRRNGVTHFLMMHSDIAVTMGGWADKMLALMLEHEADVLSVVMRMKTEENDRTSTAIEETDEGNKNNPLGFRARKLTLRECLKRGKTWTDPMLLVNTGLMLVDIRKPWSENVWFEFRDWLGVVDDGTDARGQKPFEGKRFFPVSLAEDYGFSRMVRAQGGKLVVTTEIPAWHCGGGRFGNQGAAPTVFEDVKPYRRTADDGKPYPSGGELEVV